MARGKNGGETLFGLGIDSGSTMTKGVLYDGSGIVAKKIFPTSSRPGKSIHEVYNALFPKSGKCYTVTTGYGRSLLQEADKTVTEISCHARGAVFLEPGVRCVIDIGGQDCKAILLDPYENVQDFLMNDKCAAGTGRFIEMMSRTLELNPAFLDDYVKDAKAIKITSMCTVFAESEIVSRLAEGEKPENIALGVIESICRRTANFAGRLPIAGDIFFSGGLSHYESFRRLLEQYLGQKVRCNPEAQFTGAIGAALLGWKYGQRM